MLNYYDDYYFELTCLIQIIFFITFFILLGFAIYMISNFYICDKKNTEQFLNAEKKGPIGSKEHTLFIINSLCADGLWPFAYVAAAILTPISLFIMKIPINIFYFTILFLISFMTIYFIFLYFAHHYIQNIKEVIIDYIKK
jgi:hypothetical protein